MTTKIKMINQFQFYIDVRHFHEIQLELELALLFKIELFIDCHYYNINIFK